MPYPEDRKYSKTHEWYRAEGRTVTVGITPFAADELTDITYVELPKVGTEVKAGSACGEIESVKATAELFCAYAGKILEVNPILADHPELLNKDALNEGWIFKIDAQDTTAESGLMSAEDYERYVAS